MSLFPRAIRMRQSMQSQRRFFSKFIFRILMQPFRAFTIVGRHLIFVRLLERLCDEGARWSTGHQGRVQRSPKAGGLQILWPGRWRWVKTKDIFLDEKTTLRFCLFQRGFGQFWVFTRVIKRLWPPDGGRKRGRSRCIEVWPGTSGIHFFASKLQWGGVSALAQWRKVLSCGFLTRWLFLWFS